MCAFFEASPCGINEKGQLLRQYPCDIFPTFVELLVSYTIKIQHQVVFILCQPIH